MGTAEIIAAIAGPAGMALVAWYLLTKWIPGMRAEFLAAQEKRDEVFSATLEGQRVDFREELRDERKLRGETAKEATISAKASTVALVQLTNAIEENTTAVRKLTSTHDQPRPNLTGVAPNG